ncbi:MAG: alpha/beta hydrolase [Conexibacter sp.]|nr:alpha/beta hydrolase [Conexibacter sp.]
MYNIDRPVRRVRTATLALLAGAVLLLALAPLTQARGHATATAAKPTIVLVHGAWADASSWSGVIQRLQHAGYTVNAPPNLLRGLDTDSKYIAAYLKSIKGPIILAGHSYGGAVITDAATGNANVKALVYIDAFIPDEGESAGQLTAARPGSQLDPKTSFAVAPFPGAPAGAVDLYLTPDAVSKNFAQDTSTVIKARLASIQRPLASNALTDKSTAPAWKTIPSWAVIGTEDRLIPPAEQVFMTGRAHSKVTKVKASHVSLVSQPGAVSKVILKAARAEA